jgi:hypothetical protein
MLHLLVDFWLCFFGKVWLTLLEPVEDVFLDIFVDVAHL